jgi:hypothetical protein
MSTVRPKVRIGNLLHSHPSEEMSRLENTIPIMLRNVQSHGLFCQLATIVDRVRAGPRHTETEHV